MIALISHYFLFGTIIFKLNRFLEEILIEVTYSHEQFFDLLFTKMILLFSVNEQMSSLFFTINCFFYLKRSLADVFTERFLFSYMSNVVLIFIPCAIFFFLIRSNTVLFRMIFSVFWSSSDEI